ncbi:MAG TPA: DNA-directed RNA polymerase subunit D [Nanoarchaeota archaeon]|nr:DNA-directed RNA polymerase subunit D [Candidatus Woesearchaeota archaeon]HIH15450.1 DNA-directed RNA polymerase subunit D [Nanoarchaeota archaeon]HIH59253.1 DNA-directed RNA polymerase subunit D [Nanoarchaeota archaeon]HII13952.1 DNA-directed RNA polymerase subunit D [Nanoarchaeota archaeon]HIJ04710.1 DNA-directed RNA polymerase subunit D [Nanoarchaeota archaeon]
MEIKLLSKDKAKVRVHVKGTTAAEMNTYRRTILDKLPAMAIDTVEFLENSSALYDEMLAHRLGLVVLKTDVESYFIRENCKCKGVGCARCTLDLTLDVEGPCMVYAEQLKSKDPAVIPVHGKTLLVKLLANQKVKLIAHAILSSGNEHIKFSPGIMYYQGYPNIKIADVKSPDAIAGICPTGVFSSDHKKLVIKNKEACTLCMACVDASKGEVEVKGSETEFIVTIEPWGQLTATGMVEGLVDALHEQIDALSEEIKKLK